MHLSAFLLPEAIFLSTLECSRHTSLRKEQESRSIRYLEHRTCCVVAVEMGAVCTKYHYTVLSNNLQATAYFGLYISLWNILDTRFYSRYSLKQVINDTWGKKAGPGPPCKMDKAIILPTAR